MIRWVYFKSTMFRAEPEEEEEVNPGKCGKQLANWLAKRLDEKGVTPKRIYPEDWGYEIAISGDRLATYVGCQNWGDSVDEWACFIEIKKRLTHLFSKVDVADELTSLQKTLTEILSSESQIAEIQWE